MKHLKYGQVSVDVAAEDGLARATVSGEVRRAHAHRIMSGSSLWAPKKVVQIVDYSRTRVLIEAEELFRTAQLARPGDTPTALVVPADAWVMFQDYVRMHADAGILKAAFLSRERAERWALDQMAVRAFWCRVEGVLGSSR